MKIIHNIAEVTLHSGNVLLVNTLNGLMDEIDAASYAVFKNWKASDDIPLPVPEENKNLYDKLLERGYLVEDDNTEAQVKEKMLEGLRKTYEARKETLDSICFIPTYDCNFACTYCFESKGGSASKNKFLTTEMVDKVFEIADGRIKNVSFFGGEPLLLSAKPIVEYIVAKWPNANYAVTTNGYHLEEFFDVFKKVPYANICITLDGPKEMHDASRIHKDGVPTYDKIMAGAEQYLQASMSMKIRMNLDKSMYESCVALRHDLYHKWEKYRDNIIFELAPRIGLPENERSDIYRAELTNSLVFNDETDPTRLSYAMGASLPIINYFATGKPFHPIFAFCEAHFSQRFFDPDGYIYSCILGVGQPETAVGTYYPEFKMYDKSFFTRNITNVEKCASCKYAVLCGGGCPYGMKDIMQPNCSRTMHLLHNTLPDVYRQKLDSAK